MVPPPKIPPTSFKCWRKVTFGDTSPNINLLQSHINPPPHEQEYWVKYDCNGRYASLIQWPRTWIRWKPVKIVVPIIPFARHIRDWPNYVWWKIIMEDPSLCVQIEMICATFGNGRDVYESPRSRCKHGIVCTVRKVKKDRHNQGRLFDCCHQIDSCGFFEWKEIESHVTKTGFVLFSDPLQYRYKKEHTGETFTSCKINAKEAYEEFLKKYE